jgi:two-component SAPR family response regulator
MITNYVEYAPSGYEVGVFRYLLKPVAKEDVLRVLDDMQSTASSSQKIIIKSFHESIIVKSESLIYVEVKAF